MVRGVLGFDLSAEGVECQRVALELREKGMVA